MKRLLIFSYYSGFPARVTSEWVDDRIRVASSLGWKITLITSPQSSMNSTPLLRVVRLPSLSFEDFRYEIKEMRTVGRTIFRELHWVAPWFVIAMLIGSGYDLVFRLLAGARSSGMYSWVLTSTIAGLLLSNSEKVTRIYATGGPSAAQISGTIVGRLTGNAAYLEFQDPFIGSEMHVSSAAGRILSLFERFFSKRAAQITMVTEKAGADFQARNHDANARIRAELPGSWSFNLKRNSDPSLKSAKRFVITHVGTLYGGRNLDSFFEGLDLLPDDVRNRVVVQNIGGVYVDRADEYRKRENFNEIGYLPRLEALTLASQSDALLLVQHRDSRSHETIPYKTYDYLNLGLPILALVDNPELSTLITNCGGIASDVHSPEKIASDLVRILDGGGALSNVAEFNPKIQETFTRLIGLE